MQININSKVCNLKVLTDPWHIQSEGVLCESARVHAVNNSDTLQDYEKGDRKGSGLE